MGLYSMQVVHGYKLVITQYCFYIYNVCDLLYFTFTLPITLPNLPFISNSLFNYK